MKILRIAQKIYPDITGGGPYHVHALSRDQASMGHDVTVLTVTKDDTRPSVEMRDGYRVVRKPIRLEILGNGIAFGVPRHLVSLNRYDLIHAHSHLYFSTNVAAMRRRVGSLPLAITNHGLYSQSAPRWMFDLYLRTLGRFTFNSADALFCYTEKDRQRLRNLGVNSQIHVVPNGIETSRFTPEGPVGDHGASGDFLVLFVGRLVKGKRPQDAIEAVAAARQDNPNITLLIAGNGPMRPELERLASERGISESVSFLGEVDYGEMPKLYRAADLFLLPSRTEGFPRTVLEALATELPVITSDLDQLRGVVDEVGFTAEIGDISGFAAAIRRLKHAPEKRRDFGVRGRELVEERFTWRSTVQETTDHLSNLVDADPSSSGS